MYLSECVHEAQTVSVKSALHCSQLTHAIVANATLVLTLSCTAQFFGNMSVGLAGERFMMVKNEFEVVHVPRFREPDVVQFADAVEATHGIYEHRWVDFRA